LSVVVRERDYDSSNEEGILEQLHVRVVDRTRAELTV
jgi:hypothetical protein